MDNGFWKDLATWAAGGAAALGATLYATTISRIEKKASQIEVNDHGRRIQNLEDDFRAVSSKIHDVEVNLREAMQRHSDDILTAFQKHVDKG